MLRPYHLITALIATFVTTGAFGQLANPGFVQQDMIKTSGITTDAQIAALPLSGVSTSRVYFDGLGRSLQMVGLQASPTNNKDVIQLQQYNSLGQQVKSYLPYVDNSATNPYGSYRSTAVADQASYYSASS